MKKFLVLCFLLVTLTVTAVGQAFRYDPTPAQVPINLTGTTRTVSSPLNQVTITVYKFVSATKLCSSGGCTLATTYTDSTGTVACPAPAQVTLTGTSVCQSTTDSVGNFGFWLAIGVYQYCVTGNGITPNCWNFAIAGGGSGPALPLQSIQGNNNGVLGGIPGTLFSTANGITEFEIYGPTPWMDVTAWGADPKGLVDSGGAIQNAFNNCNGGTIFFPPGNYIHNTQLINNGPCTIVAAYPGTVTLTKNYNAPGGRPGASGSWLVESSNVTLDGLIYNGGQSSGFTGLCITVVPTSATPITDVHFSRMTISNCDVAAIDLTSSSGYTFNGPSRVQITDSHITCPASSNAVAAINGQGTISGIQITNSIIDCSASTFASTGGAINFESQGTTTAITDVLISHNILGCGTLTWGAQIGGFNGGQTTGLVFTDNILNLEGASQHGCTSFAATVGAVLSGNEYNANGISSTYTAAELIYDSGSNVTGNTFNWENPGTGAAITCNMCNSTTITANKIVGFGETGDGSNLSAGIAIDSTHNNQTLNTGSIVVTGTSELVTAPAALTSFWQPGSSICIGGATIASLNICGIMQNASYNRAAGTFTLYNPTSGSQSCTGACTTSAMIYAENNNNVFSSNEINLPCLGTLTNNRYGILIRATGSLEVASDNKVNNNVINGCGNGAAGDYGIRSTGTAVEDSNTYNDNKFVNLAVGWYISQGTHMYIRGTEYINVAAQTSISGSFSFAQTDFPVPFADLATCDGTTMLGKTAEVTNATLATFGSTVATGGANHVLARCSQSGNWTVAGGP